MGDDWDLQAVVRGRTTATTSTNNTTTPMDDPFSFFAHLGLDQDDHLLCFPDPFETQTALEELEALCKPFFPKFEPLSPQSISTSLSAFEGLNDDDHHQQQQQQKPLQPPQQKQPQRSLSVSTTSATPTTTSNSQTPRSKRRKNQQKRVVCQVPAEGLSSDMWAWRKYGQKPIKGSPYPRGYYRCSSSKGCLARKQVERSRSDPGIFIITYTAEHNHPVPTHRNSLAGSTRHKFPTPQRGTTAGEAETPTNKQSCSSPASITTGLSPTTPPTSAIEDEILQQSKQESREDEGEEMAEEEDDEELLIPDIVMSDDFFMGLDELALPTSATFSSASPTFDDCFSDHFPATFPPPWLAHNAATAASGS